MIAIIFMYSLALIIAVLSLDGIYWARKLHKKEEELKAKIHGERTQFLAATAERDEKINRLMTFLGRADSPP